MLAKLFRYDSRAIGKPMALFSVIALIAAVVGAVVERLFSAYFGAEGSWGLTSPLLSGILTGSMGMIVVACWLVVPAFAVMTLILILRRYYTHFFTDEGYLTFTLPVKAHTHLLSKLFAGFLWICVGAVVVMVCLGILILVGTADQGLINQEVVRGIKEIFRDLFSDPDFRANAFRWIAEVILAVISSAAYTLSVMYLAITLGSIVAKKHKILASIGFYYGITTAISMVVNVFSIVSVFTTISAEANQMAASPLLVDEVLLVTILLSVGVTVGCFFLNRHFLRNKLNLN